MEPIKVSRVTYPTAAFSLGAQHIDWVARRAAALGTSKSKYVRFLIERDMNERANGASNPEPMPQEDAA